MKTKLNLRVVKNVLCPTWHVIGMVRYGGFVAVIFDKWRRIRNCNSDLPQTFLYLTVEFLRSRTNNIPNLFDDLCEKSNSYICLEEIVAAATIYPKTPFSIFERPTLEAME